MHPLTAIHDWIVGHPIAFTLILFAIGIPFSVYASEVKAFLRLPPQKLGMWILKARINANETQLIRWKRITSEPAYIVYLLMGPFGMVGAVLLLYALEIYGLLTIAGNIAFVKHVEPFLILCTVGSMFIFIYILWDFHQLFRVAKSIELLEAKIARLKAKLPSA